jgi:hypothetical protein
MANEKIRYTPGETQIFCPETDWADMPDEHIRLKCLDFASRNPQGFALEVAKEMYAWVKEGKRAEEVIAENWHEGYEQKYTVPLV